tara:strand:+ start:2318 stop:2872 length:555 start_codon:yes stop_codon:yes gene_type:complete
MGDKEFIRNVYLPKLKGRILFVGYSSDYNYDLLVPNPDLFESVDIDETKNPTHVCDFIYEFESEYKYDHISLHGLWGNGFVFIDGKLSENKYGHGRQVETLKLSKMVYHSIQKAHSMLEIGGTLEIGPNTNNVIPIYNSLIKSNVYQKLYRVDRGVEDFANCIFWGKKLIDNKINFEEVNLWKE